MCQPYHDHGQWITTYDIVKKKKKMSLVHHDGFGKCSHECETIAYACEDVREHYEEELPEYLYAKMSTAKLQKKICKRFCKGYKKKPKMEDNWGDEEWQELAEDQRNMFRSFVMGELSKREQPKDEQQEYLQRYAEAYIDQQETEKQQKAAKRRYENKQRARKGLPPLPEEDEEEEGKADEEGEGQTNEETDANTEQESNAEDANTDKTDL